MTLEHVNFIPWAPQHNGNIHVLFIHQAELGKLGGGKLLALYVGIIIHPSNIRMAHYSSQYFYVEVLLITKPPLKIMTLFIILFPFKMASFIIHTSVRFFP